MVTGVLADRHPVKLHLFRTYEEPPNSETDHRFHCPKSYKGTCTNLNSCLLHKIPI